MEGNARPGQEWWGELTDDDLDKAGGKANQLIGLLQQKYGYPARKPKGIGSSAERGQVKEAKER